MALLFVLKNALETETNWEYKRCEMIEYTNLKDNYELFREEYEEAILRASRSGWYILGPELEAFESSFAKVSGTYPIYLTYKGTGNCSLTSIEILH